MVIAMVRPSRKVMAVALLVVFGISAVSAADLTGLSQKCARQGGDSCAKLKKELEHCKEKDMGKCATSLTPLPVSILAEISEDSSIDPAIRNQAQAKAQNLLNEQKLRLQRCAGFRNLKAGMTVAEVEATIGPINASLKKSVDAAANMAATAAGQEVFQTGHGEIHVVYTDIGWSQRVGAGNPKN